MNAGDKCDLLGEYLGQYRRLSDLEYINLMGQKIIFSDITKRLTISGVVIQFDSYNVAEMLGNKFEFVHLNNDVYHLARKRVFDRPKRKRISPRSK